MKIYLLDVPPRAQPPTERFRYPPHNRRFGIEQDFAAFLKESPDLLTHNSHEADFHYLPIFWTRWLVHRDYGSWGTPELQAIAQDSILDDSKTFTICQYDDGPRVDLGKTVICLASRKGSEGIDVPLLSTPHLRPLLPVRKRYLASFIGRLHTHPIRLDLARHLRDVPRVLIRDRGTGSRQFVRSTVASFVCLAPRGYGGSSFRFFEAMQLGVVPYLVGELDTRPFKELIDWAECSFYSQTPREIMGTLEDLSDAELRAMGRRAQEVWQEELARRNWCSRLIKVLETRVKR